MAEAHTVAVLLKLRDEVTQGLRRVKGEIDGFSSGLQRHQKTFRQTGLALTGMAVAGGAAFALATKSFVAFEQQLANAGAVAGATGAQMESMSQVARELGRTTVFTATQSAEALSFLARAGFEVSEATEALPGVLQLAAAAQIDLARAADITSNVLAGYGFEVRELARVNDVLTKAFTSANTDLNQLGEALKFAGPVASAAGVAFEETSAALALMGNAGIQATMAGTALRGAIARMLTPTNEAADIIERLGLNFLDTAGNLLPLVDIIRQLEDVGLSAADGMEIFGLRAGPALLALVSQGADALQGLTTELQNAGGTAQEIADRQLATLGGQLTLLRSALEGVAIEIGAALAPSIAKAANLFASIAETISSLDPKLIQIAVLTAGIGIAFAAVAGPILLFLGFLPAIIAGATGAAGAIVALKVAMIALGTASAGPLGLVIAGVSLLAAFLVPKLFNNADKAAKGMDALAEATTEAVRSLSAFQRSSIADDMQSISDRIFEVDTQLGDLKSVESFGAALKNFFGLNSRDLIKRLEEEAATLQRRFSNLATVLQKDTEAFKFMGSTARGVLDEIIGDTQKAAETQTAAFNESFEALQERLTEAGISYQDLWANQTALVVQGMAMRASLDADQAIREEGLRSARLAAEVKSQESMLKIIAIGFDEWQRLADKNNRELAAGRQAAIIEQAGLNNLFGPGSLNSVALNVGPGVLENLQNQPNRVNLFGGAPVAISGGANVGGTAGQITLEPDTFARHQRWVEDLQRAFEAGEIGDIFTAQFVE